MDGSMKRNDRLIQTSSTSLVHANLLFYHSVPRLSLRCELVTLALTEHIAVLLERGADELGLLPQVRGEEAIGVGNSDEGSLQRVLEGLGGTRRGSVDVADTGKLEKTLDSW